jgi:hypothetical protein
MKFTVLLLDPDYVANQYGEDTYLSWTEAESVEVAIERAQREAAESRRRGEEDWNIMPEDFTCLFCTYGHVDDLSS